MIGISTVCSLAEDTAQRRISPAVGKGEDTKTNVEFRWHVRCRRLDFPWILLVNPRACKNTTFFAACVNLDTHRLPARIVVDGLPLKAV